MAELQAWRLYFDVFMAIACLLYVSGVLWFRHGIPRQDDVAPSSAIVSDSAPVAAPFVSIIVAARDEAAHIGAALDALEGQTYPPNQYEIIVVNDGSVDRTAELVRERERSANSQHACAVRLVSVPTQESAIERGRPAGSKKVALQHGIDVARGDIILSTDADCRVPPGWVSAMSGEFAPGVGMVIGCSRIGDGIEPLGLRGGWEAVDFHQLMLAAMGSAGRGHAMAASGQSLGFRRQAFEQVGGYQSVLHRASGDDVLLLQLIRGSGDWQIRFCQNRSAIVDHPGSNSWRSLLSQRARWASNAPCQVRLDPVFFGYLSVTFTFGLMLLLSPLLVLSGVLSPAVLLLSIGCKIASELSLLGRGNRLFPVGGMLRHYPFWALLNPVYLVCVGVLGCLGRFSWKDGAFSGGVAQPPRDYLAESGTTSTS